MSAYVTRGQRVAFDRRQPHLERPGVEFWDSRASGGGYPNRRGLALHQVDPQTGEVGFWLKHPVPWDCADLAPHAAALLSDLDLLNRTPRAYHGKLQDLLDAGRQAQALELARSLTGEGC